MLLDGNNLERLCKAGDIEARIAPFEIGHDPSISEYKPYEYIYCRYVRTVQLFLSYCLIFLFIFIIPLHIIFNLYYLASYFFLSFPSFLFFFFLFSRPTCSFHNIISSLSKRGHVKMSLTISIAISISINFFYTK